MGSFLLEKENPGKINPVLLVILDGVGIYDGMSQGYPGNALDRANAPVFKGLLEQAPVRTLLQAHGKAVGLPSDEDMGNSEVGHNAMGAGRVFTQGAKLVTAAIETRELFTGRSWMDLIGNRHQPGLALQDGSARSVHFLGLLSDGNVHSHIKHLMAMIRECAQQGVARLYVHILLDGRDVEEISAHRYIDELETLLAELDPQRERYLIASGGGRMKVTMDRYEADWDMVKLGWQTHVAGKGPMFSSTREAIEVLRQANPGVTDQDLPAFVIGKRGEAIGTIQDDDIVIFFNFRGDRGIEISRAFTEEPFSEFVREPMVKVHYAGMMEYDGDRKIPPRYLVEPPAIDRTVSEYLAHNGIAQFAISETQKYGHVTYFWNGNNSEKFHQELETWQEISSDRVSFDQKPRMKADEITDALIDAMETGRFQFLRVNYPNGDMVGHTGVLEAAVAAIEAVDQNLDRLLARADELGYTVMVTADHGNCDQMIEIDKKTGAAKKNTEGKFIPKTSHTLSPVPFLLTGKDADSWQLSPAGQLQAKPGLGNIAATILKLLGFEKPEDYLPSLVVRK